LLVGRPTFIPVIRWSDAHAVAAQVGIFGACDEAATARDSRVAADGFGGIDFFLLFRERDSLGKLFIRQFRARSETAIAFQRSPDHVLARPQSLDIGVTPRCLWRSPRSRRWFRLGNNSERRQCYKRRKHENDETQKGLHLCPPISF